MDSRVFSIFFTILSNLLLCVPLMVSTMCAVPLELFLTVVMTRTTGTLNDRLRLRCSHFTVMPVGVARLVLCVVAEKDTVVQLVQPRSERAVRSGLHLLHSDPLGWIAPSRSQAEARHVWETDSQCCIYTVRSGI